MNHELSIYLLKPYSDKNAYYKEGMGTPDFVFQVYSNESQIDLHGPLCLER